MKLSARTYQQITDAYEQAQEMRRKALDEGWHDTTLHYWDGKCEALSKVLAMLEEDQTGR